MGGGLLYPSAAAAAEWRTEEETRGAGWDAIELNGGGGGGDMEHRIN